MERNEGGEYETGGEAVARTRPKAPTKRSFTLGYATPFEAPR